MLSKLEISAELVLIRSLTSWCSYSVTHIGLARGKVFTDLRLYIDNEGNFSIEVDGKTRNEVQRSVEQGDEPMTKEELESRPVVLHLAGLDKLEVGWCTTVNNFAVKLRGIKLERLERLVKSDGQARKQLVRNDFTGKLKLTLFYFFFGSHRHVVQACFDEAKAEISVRMDGKYVERRQGVLDAEAMFPITLDCQAEEGFTAAVGVDLDAGSFTLAINDVPFSDLPELPSHVPLGPQYVNPGSRITLNSSMIELELWSPDSFQNELVSKNGAKPVTSVSLEGLQCSAPDVTNDLISYIGQRVQSSQLRSFSIKSLRERGTLQEWAFLELVAKAKSCTTLEV